MRRLYLAIVVLPLLISGCGNSFWGAPAIEDRDVNALFSVGDENSYAGNYNVILVEFDSDTAQESSTNTVVTNVMRNVDAVDRNGRPITYQAKIVNGTLSLFGDGTYRFAYSFENSSGQTVTIGKFSECHEEGEFTSSGNIIEFTPFDDTSRGFAPTDLSGYSAKEELGTIVLQAISPSPTGDYLTKVTLVKK